MRFYQFRQNNTFGTFDVDENVNVSVIIEANDAEHANARAQEIGIYFDGCAEGRDCDCCGDRWYPVSEYEAADFPHNYGDPLTESSSNYTVHYADGRKESK